MIFVTRNLYGGDFWPCYGHHTVLLRRRGRQDRERARVRSLWRGA